ncbi:MAG: hypothetical protein WA885_24030 [Phormidesmis sp.]
MLLAIIWRGWGILAIVIPAIAVVLVEMLADAVLGEGAYQQNNEWLFALGLLIASPIVWLVGRRLNQTQPRQLVDPTTGETVILQKRHSMFFIKFEYWAFVFVAIAAALVVNGCQPAQEPEVVLQPQGTEETTEETTEATPVAPAIQSEPTSQDTVQRNALETESTTDLAPKLASEPAQTQYGPDNSEVDLMAAKVTGDIMTVTLRYRTLPNESLRTNYSINEVSYIDDATSKRYGVVQDESGAWLASPKNSVGNISININNNAEITWFKFPAPPPEAQTISINVPEVSPFDGVSVER